MKKFVIAILTMSSMQVLAADKKMVCAVMLDGTTVLTKSIELTDEKYRVALGTINDLSMSVSMDPTSSIVTLSMVEMPSLKYYGGHGSFGLNGEGVAVATSVNGKKTIMACSAIK